MELIFSIYPYTHHIVINNNTQNQIYTCTKFSPYYFHTIFSSLFLSTVQYSHHLYPWYLPVLPCIVRIVYSLLSIAVNPSDDIVLQRWDFILFPVKTICFMAVDPSRSRQQSAPAFVSDFCDRIASLVFDDSPPPGILLRPVRMLSAGSVTR